MQLKTTLSLAQATTIVETALGQGRAEKMTPLTVVVLDVSGRIVAVESEDGSGLGSVEYEEALAAASPATANGSRLLPGPNRSCQHRHQPGLVRSRGRLIGAIGG